MSEPLLKFFVAGTPKTGGSKKAFVIPGTNRATVTEDTNNVDWKNSVRNRAVEAMAGRPLYACPLRVTVIFLMQRPGGHFRAGNPMLLKRKAPEGHGKKPDVLKLMRSTEDAMTGTVWRDDASNIILNMAKIYGPKPGAFVTVESCDDDYIRQLCEHLEKRGKIWKV